MIDIAKTDVNGFDAAIRGMRNPMNSWDNSDSILCKGGDDFEDCHVHTTGICPRCDSFKADVFCVGENDYKLMKTLVAAGTDHSKFMRMITVTADVTAPLYWWKEYDTYKVGTVANSCSTMHSIHKEPFTLDNFSFEKWVGDKNDLNTVIAILNSLREDYLKSGVKEVWYSIIQFLPSSYNQKRTIQLNYAVLRNIYHSRKDHKLDEWHEFCDWISKLPYSDLITA